MKLKKIKLSKNILRIYKESFEYIRETKKFILAAVLIFFAFSAVGFFIPSHIISSTIKTFVPSFPEIQEVIIKFIEELLEKTQNMSQTELTSFIFLNNLQSSFLGMILGIFFGVFPVITIIVNGYLLGYVALATTNAENFFSLWRILPHGIFELPAIFISIGLGIKLGTFIFYDKKIKSLEKFFVSSLKVFLFVVVPLLIVAAVIEGALIFLTKIN